MKFILMIMMVLSSVTYATQGDLAVSKEEALTVIQILKTQPQNLSATLLQKMLTDLQSQKELTLIEPLVFKYSNSQSYSIHFQYVNHVGGNTEGVVINVDEVSVATGKPYVFSFHTERLMSIRKNPGVSAGTR